MPVATCRRAHWFALLSPIEEADDHFQNHYVQGQRTAAAGGSGNGLKLGHAKHDCKHVDEHGHYDPGCFAEVD